MKIIKKESEVLWLLIIDDDLFTYDTPLGETFDEFNRLSRMDDDLFTFEVRILGLSCPLYDEPYYKQQFNDYVEIKRKNDMFEHDTDMEYDPSDVDFSEWIASKFTKHSTMAWYTKNALWMYWIRGDDKEVLTDKELSDLEETYINEDDEIAEIFRIKTNIFDFKTPLCKAFNEFNYLLKIETDFLTHDIPGFKTRHLEWLTCHSIEDGYYDEEDLPGMNQNENMVYSQDYKWRTGKRNEEAIKDKREPMNDYGVSDSDDHLVSNNAPDYANKEEEQYKEGRCKLLKNPCEILPTCKIKRFEVIKYSFGPAEEFVSIKEYGHNDWTKTDDDACHQNKRRVVRDKGEIRS
ncbi:hypothetical protein Tco_0436109 [Tanacetum coccineum]